MTITQLSTCFSSFISATYYPLNIDFCIPVIISYLSLYRKIVHVRSWSRDILCNIRNENYYCMWNLMDNKNIQRYISDKMKIKIKYHTVWIVLKYKYIVEKLKFATISSLQILYKYAILRHCVTRFTEFIHGVMTFNCHWKRTEISMDKWW